MTTIAQKAAHVRQAPQSRRHACHWPGCGEQVPPAMWGCRKHWYALPAVLRRKIWATYRVGQEADRRPSAAYLEAALEVRAWIAANATPGALL